MASVRRLAIYVTGGLAVLVGSFWLTLQLIDRFSTPADPDADLIKVTQATYGSNCQGRRSPRGPLYEVKTGNATQSLSASCTGSRKACDYLVDVFRLGDAAPGCGKDLVVEWRCGPDEEPHMLYLNGEANTQHAYLTCP